MPRTLLTLALIGLIAAALLAGVHELTDERIADQAERRALATLNRLVSPDRYDNRLLDDRIRVTIAGLESPSIIYRARADGEPVALLADVTTADGYSGDIRLLVGLRPDGELIGVRVLEHRETPGLGDRIERDRSDWIEQFAGRSLGDPPGEQWAPDRRGGAFDTLSSATITSAAVIDAVARVLEWFEANRDNVFETASEPA
jgi:electron transport complex protein RnfG